MERSSARDTQIWTGGRSSILDPFWRVGFAAPAFARQEEEDLADSMGIQSDYPTELCTVSGRH